MKLKPSYRICTLFLSHRLNSPFVAEVGDAEAWQATLPGESNPSSLQIDAHLLHLAGALGWYVAAALIVLEVGVPMQDEVSENFLEIHEVKTGKLITILELGSPVNKLHKQGREEYKRKCGYVCRSWTNPVEIDLLRAGDPMPVVGAQVQSDYRILVSRGIQRPRASLIACTLRQPIPAFMLPLLPNDDEPEVALNRIFHALYQRARFDLRFDYSQPPIPPLAEADAAWARELITAHGLGQWL
jgi:hypothetical protein